MKYRVVFIIPVLLLLSGFQHRVLATNSTESASNTTVVTTTYKPIEAHATQKAEIQTRIQDQKAIMVENKTQLMENREAKIEEIKAKREEVKAHIEGIKDAAKKRIAERIQQRLTKINDDRTAHFAKLLDKLSQILDKIAARTSIAKENNKDVVSIESAITSAQTSISNAQTSVETQAGKTYMLEVSNEEQARGEVQNVKEQLRIDLNLTRDVVKAAHDAVKNVFQAIKIVTGEKEATPSVSPDSSGV